MPTKAFLHKKSLLDQFKDDYKSTGYIQSARAEHTWSNPLTRRKRTNKLNGWIKSFQGKRHVHKLARFNAMQNENLEEAMSLKGFLSNISDKLVNKYGLDKNKVQNYLGSHTQEMQELLDDKELSLKEKVLFVRSEITGEKDEAKKSERLFNKRKMERIALSEGSKVSPYLVEIAHKILTDEYGWKASTIEEVADWLGDHKQAFEHAYGQALRSSDNDKANVKAGIEAALDEEERGVMNAEIAMMGESKKQTNEMIGNKKWVIRIKRLGKNYYVCSSSFRVNKAFRYPSLGGPFVCSDWDITERDIAKYDNYNDAKKAWDGMAQALRGGLPFYKEGEDYEIVQVNFSMMGESKKHEGYGGTKSVMSIWGNRPRDVYPEVSYSSVNDMYNTLLKYGYGDKHPIYYKNNSPEQIKGHILGYFKWTPTNSDADIEADALAAATMIKNNFNKSESKKSEFYMDGDDSEDYYYCHRCGRVTPSYELDAHGGFCSDCDARWTAEHENESKDTDEKLGYEKGHKNSRGEDAPWVIRSHEDNRILASFAKKKDAEEHLKRMKQYSKQEAYVDNSATAQKDYVERVISAVQDYYGYSLFNAKNLVQRNAKKVKDWYMSGEVSDVEAARCLGGNFEPTKKSEATGDKNVFTIDLYRIDDDGEENSIDDMQASQIIYDEDEAIKVANELADSYADDDGVVFAVVMAGEREKPNGDIVGEPFDIHWASSGNPEKTAEYRKKAGYATFDNAMDYYAKKTESSDDDLRSRMKKIGYDLLENGNLHSWEYDFIKECLDFSEFKKLEQYLIRKGWYTIPTESKKSEGTRLELEDTLQVPEWLWKAYILDDTTDLEEDEIEKLNDFREKYKDYHLDDKSEDPYFSSRNDFDELGGNVYDVDAYKMFYKPTEKKSEAIVDVIESPSLRKVVKSWDWTCKKCGKPGARFADYDKDGNRIPGFLCKDCLQEMDGEKSEAVKDFPDGANYKFTFGFHSPKTANIAKDAAEKNGYVATSDWDNNVSFWTKEPQDAIRFADTTVNLANEDERTKLERSDVDKAFAIAVTNKGYSENKETIDNATAEYAVVVHPFESFDGFSVMGELTDVVDFLETIK